uniref:Uncharacterized protein n=1 Tax=Cacopsylla melanoneura TaxID=428564 RepID=A0A8D9E6V7_9HEMI
MSTFPFPDTNPDKSIVVVIIICIVSNLINLYLFHKLDVNILISRYKSIVVVIIFYIVSNLINLYLFNKLDVNIPIWFLVIFYLPNNYDKLYKVNDFIFQ